MTRSWAQQTRYTLRRHTASIMKGFWFVLGKMLPLRDEVKTKQ